MPSFTLACRCLEHKAESASSVQYDSSGEQIADPWRGEGEEGDGGTGDGEEGDGGAGDGDGDGGERDTGGDGGGAGAGHGQVMFV